MGLIEKVLGKKDEDQEFPEEFEPSVEAQKAIQDVDEDITTFLQRKDKEKIEEKKPVPIAKKEEIVDQINEEEIEEPEKETPNSNLSQTLTIYVDEKNIEKSKEALRDSIKEGYTIGLQAGIQVNSKNIINVNAILEYLVKHEYLVVVSAEKIDTVF